jgi:hypothetical protein
MSVYLISDSIIFYIDKMLNSFWWGDGSNKKGIWWLAWDRLARPKAEGRLGFRKFHAFNMSMIARQAWKFISEPGKLVTRIFKARYFRRSSYMMLKLVLIIVMFGEVFVNGCRWKICDGRNIKIMSDPWLRGEDTLWLQSPQVQKYVQFIC